MYFAYLHEVISTVWPSTK